MATMTINPNDVMEKYIDYKTWDAEERPISISNIKDMLDKLGSGEKANIVGISKQELELLKAALDCYCNVGEAVSDLYKKTDELYSVIKTLTVTINSLEVAVRNQPGNLAPIPPGYYANQYAQLTPSAALGKWSTGTGTATI